MYIGETPSADERIGIVSKCAGMAIDALKRVRLALDMKNLELERQEYTLVSRSNFIHHTTTVSSTLTGTRLKTLFNLLLIV